jgi:hypothetical protein
MKNSPLGEARRLRYISFICDNLKEKKEIDEDYFTELVLKKTLKLNAELKKHIRSTGIMRTKAVMRNYLSYCSWLNLIKKESNILISNNYTIYFGYISNNNFILSNKEKISYFNFLIKNNKFKTFLSMLKLLSTPKNYLNNDFDEHLIETFLEWCVDLEILTSYSKKFGKYRLRHKFINFPNFVIENSDENIFQKYSSEILNSKLQISSNISYDLVWDNAMLALYRTAKYTKSEMDEKLFSALPMIYDLQMELILQYNRIIPIKNLILKMVEISKEKKVLFEWNFLADGGFVHLGDE